MEFDEACDQLNDWIERSHGHLIDIGNADGFFGFRSLQKNFDWHIRDFQEKYRILLPEDYAFFLKKIGTARLFTGEYTAGMEILSPADIEHFSESIFENAGDNLFPDLLLVVSIPKTGAFGGFWCHEKSDRNYGIFYPDVPPELWIEETDFTSFRRWIISTVNEKGSYLGAPSLHE